MAKQMQRVHLCMTCAKECSYREKKKGRCVTACTGYLGPGISLRRIVEDDD